VGRTKTTKSHAAVKRIFGCLFVPSEKKDLDASYKVSLQMQV
jgi:hypothetical protein